MRVAADFVDEEASHANVEILVRRSPSLQLSPSDDSFFSSTNEAISKRHTTTAGMNGTSCLPKHHMNMFYEILR
eukprot:scaffold4079_cov44-Cyclotella_meneghiniana.AAC.14